MLTRTERLDQGTLAALREMADTGSPDFLGELIGLFLNTFPDQLDSLGRHDAEGDLDGLRRVSHDLKSSSASVGALTLAARCAELEALARSGTMRGSTPLVRHILDEFQAVRPELEALLPSPRRSASR